MRESSKRLIKITESIYEKYKGLDEETTSCILNEETWSLKEILGHLVDSAANNYQRFIRLQISEELLFPGYGYDWVKLVPYNNFPFKELLDLWKSFNLLIAHIIDHIDTKAADNHWLHNGKKLSLGFLVEDYLEHMQIHLKNMNDRLRDVREKS